MISIGNDIIALQLINPERTKQEKFYSKILNEQELFLFNQKLFNKLPFEYFIWLAWSVKESVYKFHKRNNPDLAFSPTKIIIKKVELPTQQNVFCFDNAMHENISFKTEECYCCEINFNGETIYARSFIGNQIIFTVANNSNWFDNVYWGIKMIESDVYAHQSKAVREFVLSKLNKLYPGNNVEIQKSKAGYPYIEEHKHLPLSFTHHGNFVAYAFARH